MYLHNYLDEKYEDYKFGNPCQTAINLIKKIDAIEQLFVDAQKDFELAGAFLEPTMKQAFKNNLKQLSEVVLERKGHDGL